jgi:hypothetical protein
VQLACFPEDHSRVRQDGIGENEADGGRLCRKRDQLEDKAIVDEAEEDEAGLD